MDGQAAVTLGHRGQRSRSTAIAAVDDFQARYSPLPDYPICFKVIFRSCAKKLSLLPAPSSSTSFSMVFFNTLRFFHIVELVEEAIKISLAEDSVDLAAFDERKKEPSLAFEDVLKKLKKNGKI